LIIQKKSPQCNTNGLFSFLQNKTHVSFPQFFTFQVESTQYLAFSLRSVLE